MYTLLLLVITLGFPFLSLQQSFYKEDIIFYYNNTYKYDVTYTLYVNKSTEYIMEFGGDFQEFHSVPARVTVACDSANRTYPLFVTARQQKGVFSWQLPMLVQTPVTTEQFTSISRTLCPHNNMFDEDAEACDAPSLNTPIVHLTSSSSEQLKVTILVEKVQDFYIKINQTINITVSPSQPKYYFYPFKKGSGKTVDFDEQKMRKEYICGASGGRGHGEVQRNEVGYGWLSRPENVIVMIESDDELCAVVSIQNFSCPVFDNERDILYDGYYLTMTRRGGITLTQDTFPIGFYIVFIVKTSDEDCKEPGTNGSVPAVARLLGWGDNIQVSSTEGRVKNFRFKIVETISYREYLIAAGATVLFYASFYLAFFVFVLYQSRKSTGVEHQDQETIVRSSHGSEGQSSGEGPSLPRPTDGSSVDSQSDTESEYSTLDDVTTDKELYRYGTKLCLADLSRCRARVLATRSNRYLWTVLTVSVFYTLPVLQLVVTYQRLLNQSGNQDLCYFNFFCAHPLMMLSDFNHVFSNLGYVVLGALFLLQVWRRQRIMRNEPEEKKQKGIPQHFGLLYAMGVALISEGFLSAAYHVCPNSMNFQFDTSFMYVTSALCMVKIYQSRHPDINARAHATFGVLALIIFIGLVGVLNANVYFWVAFTALHLLTCFFITFQIYYLGRFKLDMGWVRAASRGAALRPSRGLMLLLANLINWGLAGYGVAQHSRDFASHLLLVLMTNLFLYTLFYIVMKLLHRETITCYT